MAESNAAKKNMPIPTKGDCWWWGRWNGRERDVYRIYTQDLGLYASSAVSGFRRVDDPRWVWEEQVLTPEEVQAVRDEKWHAQSSVFKLHAQYWTDKAKALRPDKEWKATAVRDDGWFSDDLGTIRVCVDCDALISGGPTRCVECAQKLS